MKVKVEKGQFRWKLLNLVFWCFMGLSLPFLPFLLVSLRLLIVNFFIVNYLTFMIAGAIASIFINICIFLQKNWPIDRRVQAALYTTICLIFAVVLIFVPYYLFLLSNHRRYDNAEYTSVYIDRKLIWSTCIGLFIVLAMSSARIVPDIMGIASSKPMLEEFHVFIILVLSPLKTSAFFALIVQIIVWIQESWSLRNKIINTIVIEVVFVSIGSMFGLYVYFMSYMPLGFILLSCIIPFIPFIGVVLLRHIFIKSSLDAVEDKE